MTVGLPRGSLMWMILCIYAILQGINPNGSQEQTGPVSYRVQGELTDQVYRRHGDQLRPRYPQGVSDPEPQGATQSAEQESDLAVPVSAAPAPPPFTLDQPGLPDPETVTLRRSDRMTKRPSRYRD
jgi:hypothetical protein